MIRYFEKDVIEHNVFVTIFSLFKIILILMYLCNLWMGSKLFSIVHCTNVLVVRTTKPVQYLQKGNIRILESLLQIWQRLKT